MKKGDINPDQALRRVSGRQEPSAGITKSRNHLTDKGLGGQLRECLSLFTLPNQTLRHKLLKEGVVTESMSSRAQVTREQQQHTELAITTEGLRVGGGGEIGDDTRNLQGSCAEGPTQRAPQGRTLCTIL